MKTMRVWQFALICVFLVAQVACKSTGGSKKTKDPEGKVLGTWEVKTLEKGGRVINITEIAGETFMEFYRMEKKEKDGNLKVTYKFRMEMGGNDRMFDFKLVNDSIQYQEVKGWNDMKIVNLDREKGEMLLDQSLDGDIIRWALEPRPDIDEEKAKQRKEDAKNAAKKPK
jgi:hypothetical protein